MARRFERLPPGSRDALLAMAGKGLKESTAATALGVPLRDFRRLITTNQAAKELWEEAMSVERDALFEVVYNRALEGDTKAALSLLAARHGMSEKQPEQPGSKVSITFQLPAAMSPEQYAKLLTHKPE